MAVMKLVPALPTQEMVDAWRLSQAQLHSLETSMWRALNAAPNYGKINWERMAAAESAALAVINDETRINTDPDANATDVTIAVIVALGLEIEE